jgi:Ulp1 family protease
MPGRDKASGEIYAEATATAQHNTETSTRWHPSFVPKIEAERVYTPRRSYISSH